MVLSFGAIVTTLSPEEIEKLRKAAQRAISPIKPWASKAPAGWGRWQSGRTKAGRNLPHYYFVYFLLVDLLQFPHSGRSEKIAWSIPIDFEGTIYLLDHRKLGMGVFCENSDAHEPQAKRIVSLISRGVRVADPFFRALAEEAVVQSHVNVKNNSASLFHRYEYLRDKFREMWAEANARKGEVETRSEGNHTTTTFPAFRLMQEAAWVGIAAIDAFFAWTEHVFIHVAIIQGRAKTGSEVSDLIEADWQTKFKRALDITDKDSKAFYDSLGLLRRQIRNYMAHGSFGKQGEAFDFHSAVGAVPVILDSRPGTGRFSFFGEPAFDEESSLATLDQFVDHLWSGERSPARYYIQDADLPLILTYASDGTYEDAMQSDEDMERFIEGLIRQMDDAANMDW